MMALSKRELQQMLREMHVAFDADASYVSLKNRLQQELHRLWRKAVSGQPPTVGKQEKFVVRKRKKAAETETAKRPSLSAPAGPRSDQRPISAPPPSSGKKASDRRPSRIQKPLPGKPWKEAADGIEPFNRKKKVFSTVLKRSASHCELCGASAPEGSAPGFLRPYQIVPAHQGGDYSIKNVVALCPACRQRTGDSPAGKVVKLLKRKARAKLYASVQVEKKRTRKRSARAYRRGN